MDARDRRGSSCSHRRKIIRGFSTFRKGLRSFTEGIIEGSSREYNIFNRGSLLKRPMFEGHDCFYPRQQVRVTLEVRVCKVCCDSVNFILDLWLSSVCF